MFIGGKARRGKQKRSDYLLRYDPDFPIAVVEAKSRYSHAADGLHQSKEYAEILGLRFAYSTNGIEIVEFDYTTDTATVEFLRFYFSTCEGLEKLGEASPGGAGRKRTLGLKKLELLNVPIPSIKRQHLVRPPTKQGPGNPSNPRLYRARCRSSDPRHAA